MKLRVYRGIRWWWAFMVFVSASLIGQTLTGSFPLQILFIVLWDVALVVALPRLWGWVHPLYLAIHEDGLVVGSLHYAASDLESVYVSNRAIMLRHKNRRWFRLKASTALCTWLPNTLGLVPGVIQCSLARNRSLPNTRKHLVDGRVFPFRRHRAIPIGNAAR